MSTTLAGLAAVAVALVAVAAKSLVAKTSKDKLTVFILTLSALISFVFSTSWMFPALILGGGIITWAYNSYRQVDMALPV
jgi:chromate transport protein ChrA